MKFIRYCVTMKTPFVPKNLPLHNIDYVSLVGLIAEANRKISLYNALLDIIPNPNVLLSTLIYNEAVISSRIEGTQATLEEVVEFSENLDEKNKKYADIQEVVNYRKTLFFAVDRIDQLSLSLPLIKEMHAILMDGVRGQNKDRGNFRKTQNRIGKYGSTIEEATYIPPSPMDMLLVLDNLEKYIHFQDKDIIVQVAILHAQFELIHPFLDGNGRIGRLLIPLYLYFKKILSYPNFYISEYFERNREWYYDALKRISEQWDRNQWIKFFLEAIVQQSNKNIERTKAIMALYKSTKDAIKEYTKSQHFSAIANFIFAKPVFDVNEFYKKTGIKKSSCYYYLKILVEKRIVLTSNSKQRNKKYYFHSLLDLA